MNLGLLQKTKQILLLTQVQLLGSFVLALAAFLVEFGAAIIQVLESDSQVTVGITGKTGSGYVLGFLRYISSLPYADNIITGLFFATAAVFLYFAFIALGNIMVSIRNEIVVDVNYSKGSVIKILLTRFGAKILAAGCFVLLCAASILLFVPFWMNMLGIFVYSGLNLHQVVLLMVGFLGLVLNIYAVWTAAYFTWTYEESV